MDLEKRIKYEHNNMKSILGLIEDHMDRDNVHVHELYQDYYKSKEKYETLKREFEEHSEERT